MDARLDHVVVWVDDQLKALDFYERVIGLPGVRAAEFRAGAVPFPSVRISADSLLDLMARSTAPFLNESSGVDGAGHRVNHICLALERADFEALRARLTAEGAKIMDGFKDSFGARGLAPDTFYFLDPDGNVLEARYYA